MHTTSCHQPWSNGHTKAQALTTAKQRLAHQGPMWKGPSWLYSLWTHHCLLSCHNGRHSVTVIISPHTLYRNNRAKRQSQNLLHIALMRKSNRLCAPTEERKLWLTQLSVMTFPFSMLSEQRLIHFAYHIPHCLCKTEWPNFSVKSFNSSWITAITGFTHGAWDKSVQMFLIQSKFDMQIYTTEQMRADFTRLTWGGAENRRDKETDL